MLKHFIDGCHPGSRRRRGDVGGIGGVLASWPSDSFCTRSGLVELPHVT